MFLYLDCGKFSYLLESLCFLFSFSIIIVPFLKFLIIFGLMSDMIFCIRNGNSFVNGVLSIDSSIMNFGKGGVPYRDLLKGETHSPCNIRATLSIYSC